MAKNQLAAVSPRSISERVRGDFEQAQVDLIRATVARDANDAELAMFLELCRRYELDPFAGQIYCAKMPGKDGGHGRIAIIVGRDGFLTIAERNPDFLGFDSDVVRENDQFKVSRNEQGHPVVQHDYEGTQTKRGKIEGAWCIVYRNGRRPRYFYAPMEEYVANKKPWTTQPSVMIEKCAVSTALRLAFNISGLVGEEEASKALAGEDTPENGNDFHFSDDEALNARLADLFAAANEIRRDAFRPKKIKLLTGGKTHGELRQVAAEVEAWIVEHGGEVPPEADVVAEAEEVTAEAEVEPDDVAEFGPMPGDDADDIPFGDEAA